MNYLILDTETTNDIDCPFCYDVGFCVVDDERRVIEQKSFTVADIFLDKELMASAFFADKIPQYIADIDEGKRELRRFATIRKILAETMAKYGIDTIIAHNAKFDYRSCQTTQRYLTNSKYRWFFPFGTRFVDTLEMARKTFRKDEKYKAFCSENGFCCKNGSPRFTAEVLTKFLRNDLDFVESHTGLEDTLIEKNIFFECVARGCEPCFLWE